jgi:hypothetical protein
VLNAIDNYESSRWTTGREQDGTDWFKVDFGGSVTLSSLTLTNGNYDQNDYPGSVALYGSTDGVNFSSSSFATASGKSDQTVVTFPMQTLRALKIRQIGTSNGGHYWSIHEFDTDCAIATAAPPAPVGTCDATKWIQTASANNVDSGKAIDLDTGTRWTSARNMVVGDYYQVNFTGMVKLSQLTLNNVSVANGDYPSTYAVYGSADGTTFDTTAFVTGSGANNQTVINFAQRSVKAVRVKVTGARSNWWSIGELQAACAL